MSSPLLSRLPVQGKSLFYLPPPQKRENPRTPDSFQGKKEITQAED